MCDGTGAICKRGVGKYVDAGHDIEVEEDLAKGINFMGDIQNVIVLYVEVVDREEVSMTKQIPLISNKHDAEFLQDSIVIRRHSGIGQGKMIVPRSVNQPARCEGMIMLPKGQRISIDQATPRQCQPAIHKKITRKDAIFPDLEEEEEEEDNDDEAMETGEGGDSAVDVQETSSQRKLWKCTEERCVREFKRYRDLTSHVLSGKHKIPTKVSTSHNQTKSLFFDMYEDGNFAQFTTKGGVVVTNLERLEQHHVPSAIVKKETPNKKDFSQGFALKQNKPIQPFSPRVKAFVAERYMSGAITGTHERAKFVMTEMQSAKNMDGSPMFKHPEYVNIQQITSLNSGWMRNQKKRGIEQVAVDSNDPDNELETRVDDIKKLKLALDVDRASGHPFTVRIKGHPSKISPIF